MKKWRNLSLILLVLLYVNALNVYAQTRYEEEILEKNREKYLYQFEYEGKKYDAYVLWFDMNDPLLRVDIAMAGDKIGSVASLEDLSKPAPGEEVLGSINAAFFNMREDTQPASTIILDGELEHIANYGSVMGFNSKNRLIIERPYIHIEGAIDGQWEAPYYWKAENINHLYQKPFSFVMLFDSFYTGKSPVDVKCVLVENNRVIGIYDEFPEIKKGQYVLCAYDKKLLSSFKLGSHVEYRSRYFFDEGNKSSNRILAFDEIKTAVGVGPTLVKGGKYAIAKDLERHSLSSFSQRSMIGMTANHRLAMVVTSKMSFDALAHLALDLGLKDAINLDGGGSSSMMTGDMPIRSTSRKLSNAVVVKKVKSPLTRVKLNDIELYFDVEPFVYEGRTMLPMRKIMEKLGCHVEYDVTTKKIIVDRYQKRFEFRSGSNEVVSGNKTYKMDVPILIHGGRSFISVRFLTEFLGGTVAWDQAERLVSLDLPTTQTYYEIALALYHSKSYDYALNEFAKVLDMNKEHIGALKYSAAIYEKVLFDYRSALVHYSKIHEILPDDIEIIKHLIHLYTKLGAEAELIKMYQELLEKEPSDFAYIGLARLYKNIDRDRAKLYYLWVNENSKNSTYVYEAKKYLEIK